MLEIFTNGSLTDLSSDTEITLTYEQPLLSDDRVVAPYTFSYDLPLTPGNRMLFGYPDRAASNSSFQKIPSEIRFAGRVIASGTQQVDEVSDRLSVNFTGTTFPSGNRKYLCNLSLGKLDVGLALDYGRNEPRWSTEEGKTGYNDLLREYMTDPAALMIAPPVGIRNVDFPASEGALSFNRQNHLFINAYNAFGAGYKTELRDGTGGIIRHLSKIIPAFRVGKLFDMILGNRLQNNIFNTDAWNPLVLVGRWHPKYFVDDDSGVWDILDEVDERTKKINIQYQDFLPKVQANEFITNMLKIPCASLFMIGDGFSIETNEDVLSDSSANDDWTDKIIGIPTISQEEGREYEYGYNGDEGTVSDEIIPVKVRTIEEMYRDALGGDELKTYEIESTGQVIESLFDTETENRYKFHVVRQSMGGGDRTGDDDPEQDEKSSFDAKVNGSVLWNNLRAIINDDATTMKVFQYAPEGEAVEKDRPDSLTVGLYWGMRDQISEDLSYASGIYPYMCHCNYDARGVRLGDATLRFDGAGGLLDRFHHRFKTWIEKDKKLLTAEARLTEDDLSRLDLRRKIAVRNKLYLIKTISVTLTPRRILPAEVELLED